MLATSAAPEESDTLVQVLDAGQSVATVATSFDVEQAEPESDVLQVALQKAGVDARDAVTVGGAGGVGCIELLSRGAGAAELQEAGALAVLDDAVHRLGRLDTSPAARPLRLCRS